MPQDCILQDGTKILVSTKRDCERAGGTIVGGDIEKSFWDCFVRNVLTRTVSGTVLDIGWADAVGAEVVDALSIPSRGRGKSGSKRRRGVVWLTPAKRRALTARAGKSLLTLATTYPTTVEFRDGLLMTTRRGKQWKRYYDRHLSEIFRVAYQDLDLMNASATTWLALYPFTRAMVRAASGRRGKSAAKIMFTKRDLRACVSLIRRFRKGSEDVRFRKVLTELEGELTGYAGLSPQEAVARLQKSPPRHG